MKWTRILSTISCYNSLRYKRPSMDLSEHEQHITSATNSTPTERAVYYISTNLASIEYIWELSWLPKRYAQWCLFVMYLWLRFDFWPHFQNMETKPFRIKMAKRLLAISWQFGSQPRYKLIYTKAYSRTYTDTAAMLEYFIFTAHPFSRITLKKYYCIFGDKKWYDCFISSKP